MSSAGLVALAVPAAAQKAAGSLAPIVERLRAFAQQDLSEKGLPGMSVALVGPGGATESFAVGLANLDARLPATPDQLFQIGSITKSMTALALFALAGRGKIDLDARAAEYLPDHPLPPEPITLTHLLEHSSGLPNSILDAAFPDVPGGRLWTGFTPGSRYSYCNLGYKLLGAVIERASGMSYADALTALVLRPLGMNHSAAALRTSDRPAYAAGHTRLREDLPWLPKARLASSRWHEFEDAAGSVAANARDMAVYLRFLAGLAAGRGAPLFSDALAVRFATPTIDVPGRPTPSRYGNGLITHELDGGACFHHTGGMIGFSSALNLDRATGVGAYASVNVGGAGNYRPVEITEYAVQLLRAAAAGRPLPPERAPKGPTPVEKPELYVGRWLGPNGSEFSVAERGGALFVTSAGRERPLRAYGRVLLTDHPALSPYALVLDPERPQIRLGSRLFGRDAEPAAVPANPKLAALQGAYLSSSAWSSRRLVSAVGDRLFIGVDEVLAAPDGSWRYRDPAGASERIWFQHPVAGRPQQLNHSGLVFSRTSSTEPD